MKIEIEVPVPADHAEFGEIIELLIRRVSLDEKEAAKRVHMSERTFRRRFKRATNMTFQSAKSFYPVQAAAALLIRQKEFGLDKVSRLMNWDAIALGKVFKRVMELSPRSYYNAYASSAESARLADSDQ